MNHMDHTHGADAAAPQPQHQHRHMMMHMTFFWGTNTEILFPGWPGYDHPGMYFLSLVVVFVFAILIEWLSNCKYIKESEGRNVAVGVFQTALYGLRIGLAYMLMLAVMSFNGGVFVVAVVGHVVGFFFFGSRAFHRPQSAAKYDQTTDLPPMSCNC